MATTKRKTTAKQQSAQKKPTQKRKTAPKGKAALAAQQKEQSIWGSIGLFATGLLLLVMVFVPGQAGWAVLRTFLKGVFGVSFYLLGAAFIYVAVLVARQDPLAGKICKVLLGMVMLSGTAILFSTFSLEGVENSNAFMAFYHHGAQHGFGGGLLGAVLGGLLLVSCGRPAANIVAVVLFLCAIMLIVGITPAEIVLFLQERFGSAKNHSVAAREEYLVRRAEREEARAQQQEAQLLEERQQWEQTALPANESIPQSKKQSNNWFQRLLRQIEHTGNEDITEFEQVPVPEEEYGMPGNASVPAPVIGAIVPEQRASFDIDLGPETAQMPTQNGPEIIEIGPGGTFGRDVLSQQNAVHIDDFSMPVPQVVPEVPPAPETEDGGWISMSELPEEPFVAAPAPTVAPVVSSPVVPAFAAVTPTTGAMPVVQANPAGNEIENLVAAAMDKPKLADEAAAQTPVEEIIKINAYHYPPLSLFDQGQNEEDPSAELELKANAKKLVDTLESFGVKTRVLDISRGPSVTRYELQPLAGVKISRITNLADDIALNLSVAGVRIEAPIPGKPAVGIEVPNRIKGSVSIRALLESANYAHTASPLTFALGKDIAGVAQVADLCKMPHLLVAGSTGSGKSVCVNSIIISFLYRSSPEDLKLILIDPKVVELAEYNGIPHLLMPVITEPRKAAGALGSAVSEMEKRYRLFADNNVRDIKSYNKLAQEIDGMEKLPYIAIVIDELADLMMVSGKEVEDYICRIAQKARAAGMHLIVATQRPSVDVITGLIKANIPSRISFAVSSQIDSRTILDSAGAEKLLGMGDMLFMPVGAAKPIRIQGTYVKDAEISKVLSFIKQGCVSAYNQEMIAEMEKVAANQKGAATSGEKDDASAVDPMLKQCAEVVIDAGQASTSLLQRRCKLGYARAARIMDEMEQLHIIGPYEGSKPRAVLVNRQQWIEMCMNEENGTPEPAVGETM